MQIQEQDYRGSEGPNSGAEKYRLMLEINHILPNLRKVAFLKCSGNKLFGSYGGFQPVGNSCFEEAAPL
jgi:hypothetical protein